MGWCFRWNFPHLRVEQFEIWLLKSGYDMHRAMIAVMSSAWDSTTGIRALESIGTLLDLQ
jgi:hypothetical protein